MSAVLVSSDMLVSSRTSSAARSAGVTLSIALSAADLTGRLSGAVRLVIFDLSQPELKLADSVAAVRAAAPVARIVAFGPHVDHASLAAARAAGCDEVMSNGEFHRGGQELLRRHCGGGEAAERRDG